MMTLLIAKFMSYLPSRLPVGATEFHTWADSIIELSGKFADEDSMKYALASQIIHLSSQKGSAPKAYFVNSLRKAAANQVASQFFHDIKTKQVEAAAKAEQERLDKLNQVEVTTSQADGHEVTSDEQQKA